ncbi:MAG: RAD55 family ATPase [Halovenus sp.]
MTGTYDISGVLPEGFREELPAGTNLGILGPTMSGKRSLALQLLAAGYQTGDGILCITTESAKTVYSDLDRYVDSLDRDRVGIVDTAGSDGQDLLNATTESVSSPGDLTGISIGTAKLFRQFERRGITDIRYGLVSISTLLQYLDSQVVFKFLHIYTKRIEETGGLGIYTLNDDSHDPQTLNTITGQFDGVIQLRESETGEMECRLRGFGKRPTAWKPLP